MSLPTITTLPSIFFWMDKKQHTLSTKKKPTALFYFTTFKFTDGLLWYEPQQKDASSVSGYSVSLRF